MQTFLPYPSFEQSAAVLDRQRLGKQRVENLQIMTSLLELRGWVNHPAVKMWQGHEFSLLCYQHAIVSEWLKRGYKDTCFEKTEALFDLYHRSDDPQLEPDWLGDPEFHISHQSNLIRKKPDYYEEYFPGVPDDLPYFCPV